MGEATYRLFRICIVIIIAIIKRNYLERTNAMTQFKLNEPAPERFASDVLDNRDEITETRKAVCRVLGYTQVQLADATGCGCGNNQ